MRQKKKKKTRRNEVKDRVVFSDKTTPIRRNGKKGGEDT